MKKSTNINKFPIWMMQSKVSPCEQLVSIIERPALIRRLNLGLKGKLTLISTPSGFGKTTLLNLWRDDLINHDFQVAWLSLDADDNDPGLLASYIAFSMYKSGLQDILNEYPTDGFGPHISPKTTLGLLSSAAVESNKELVLILDNFETLGVKCIQSVIEPALKYFPPNIHLVIACRTKAQLPLSELRLSGQINEFCSMDTKFTSDEISNFLHEFLEKNQIQTVVDRTQGWPVALQYLRIAFTQSNDQDLILNSFHGTGSELESYFSEQFINTLEDEQRRFLLEASILEYISIESVNYIRNQTNSELLINTMTEIDAFLTSIEGVKNTYRLHPLLKQFLQNHLRIHHFNRYQELQQKAAHWHAKNGEIIRAIKYALEVNKQDLAADIIEQAGGVLLWYREGMSRMRAANSLFSDELLSTRPRLQLLRALVSLKDGKLNEGRKIIQHVRYLQSTKDNKALEYDLAVMLATLDAYEGSDPDEDIIELRELLFELGKADEAQASFVYTASCLSCLQTGYFDEARDFAHKGVAILRKLKMLFGIAYFDVHLGVIDFSEGHLANAYSQYQKAKNAFHRYYSDDKDMRLIINILMAEWHYEHNDISVAQRLLGDTNDRLDNGEAWYDIYAAGYGTSISIAYEKEGLNACRRLTAEAINYIQREDLRRLRPLIIANLAGFLTRSGLLKEARKLIQENGLSLQEYKTPNKKNILIKKRFSIVISLSRLLIAEKRYQEAITDLNYFIKLDNELNYNRATLKYSLLLSICLFYSGNKKKAYQLLNKVLYEVRNAGYVRLVLDENPLLKPFLTTYLGSSIASEKDHALYLLELLDEHIESTNIIKLSKRELQVIEQLSQGFSDKIIAKNLDVSNNTIRFHLKNIYSKLGVNNRMQAVKEVIKLE
ncbi:hypothetical protein BAE46_14080 [Glaciecola punicea]|uniref:LuxR C-terminal-related transcriptional regulator n=1 Tax=Glaciecola punicea TaxID=56804 RepID=UPI00087334F1|nr:LuxR C-terminal-related transcriptional regulator [Glaciecola punicea]OFA29246.1 hypothetical protein BAE46_14080 [Glaciecola punicea]